MTMIKMIIIMKDIIIHIVHSRKHTRLHINFNLKSLVRKCQQRQRKKHITNSLKRIKQYVMQML
jgi:hypothetical protein